MCWPRCCTQLAYDGSVLCVWKWKTSGWGCYVVSHGGKIPCCPPSWEVLRKVDCGYHLICHHRHLLQLFLRKKKIKKEISWIVLGLFLSWCSRYHFCPRIYDRMVWSFLQSFISRDFQILLLSVELLFRENRCYSDFRNCRLKEMRTTTTNSPVCSRPQ